MSEPGGPGRRGRHSSADDGTAGVPSARRPRAYGRADSVGPLPRHPDEVDAEDFPVPASRNRAIPDLTFAAAGRPTAGFRRVAGGEDRFVDSTGPLTEPGWWSYGSSDHPGHPLNARHSDDDRTGRSSWESGGPGDVPPNPARENLPSSPHPSAPLPPMPAGVWDRLRPRADHDRYLDGPDDGLEHDGDHYDDDRYDDAATVAHPRVTGRRGADPAPGFRDPSHDDAVHDDAHYDDAHLADAGYDDGYGDDGHAVPSSGARAGDHHDGDHRDDHHDGDQTDAHRLDPGAWEDHTGGLEVIGAHVEEHALRGRRKRRDRHAGPHPDADAHAGGPLHDEDIPVAPYDPRGGRRRRRRRPVAVLLTLIVLAGIVVGIVVGGQKLLGMINPSSRDYSGQGSGAVEIRINQGDTLSDIARTLVDDDVVASVGPFVDAAESEPDATGIQPGVYRMRSQMSGRAAVDLLLDPAARLFSRVTLREGLTVEATLAKLAETTGTPIEELTKAAGDPAALGLPEYARGKVEGFLFPATYDFEPDTTAVDMLKQMVERAVHALDELQIPADQRLTVITKASLVQAEASSTEDMAKVARVLENRLADGMPLQLDTTVNYANGKGGITTSAADRANPSPYNTYVHPGLPPGAIDNPGEDALRAVLSPAPGEWRFFVVVDPDTGDTRFAVTGAEHQQNVLLFQQWLREHPGG